MTNHHEIFIQCSDSRYRRLVGALASALRLPRQVVERNLEAIMARVIGRLACSPMTVAALIGRNPGRLLPGFAGREQSPRTAGREAGEARRPVLRPVQPDGSR